MLENWKADVGRLRRYGSRVPALRLFLENQSLWAIACYRVGSHLNRHRLPPGLRHVVMFFYHAWWLSIQMTTGIYIPPDTKIGPGLYLGHFSGIFVHPEAVLGRDCNISQGVSLGLGRQGDRWGAPILGDRVYLAPGAKVIGPVHLADGTVVGANAVVTHDTEPDAVVVGVPAKPISYKGSGEYIR